MNTEFRDLRADEIDCRIAQIGEKGLSLLLYKDARCDQKILDETVGAMNWQNHYSRDNANCVVSIWDDKKEQWISKENTGKESNTEAQKGLASDSFKRACFNWGIGRELYTAPFIWIKPNNFNLTERKGKPACFDEFIVSHIKIKDKIIVELCIFNQTKSQEVFSYGMEKQSNPQKKQQDKPKQADKSIIEEIEYLAQIAGVAISKLEKKYNVKVISALDENQAKTCAEGLKKMLADG